MTRARLQDEGEDMKNPIKVIVTRSVEPIDFEAWATQYVRAIIDADRAHKQKQAEAA